ncbi:chain-length determining protein [Hylemonella gracilis str. Niagara R]|uniref:Chain-length determining protein n=1 Tax=Hylemonella gracilis str. Niagara R TaxID=1458275 RepID=A0A016XJE3_9BURK|nr:chain length determinant protein EpsF [Hylemonella gracilis]EYC51961.1 chain-length determining protein [Hylemonella gracilis str. Niagara R]
MNIQQFFLILRARWRVALLVLLATVAITVLASLWMARQYTASAALVLDVKSPDPVSGLVLQGMVAPGYMATQIDIINSDRVAKAVVKLLHLDEGTAVRQQWLSNTQGKGQLSDWLASLLQNKLDVKPARESNVININYTGTDPDFAAAVANAFAQAYIDVNLDLRLAPARQYAAFFSEQTQAAREKLETAQKALSSYLQSNGITSADERVDFETSKLNETSSQLTGVQGMTTDSQSKRAQAQSDTVAEVMQSPLINGMKADIARMQSRISESSVNLGSNHPQTLRAESELNSLKAQLDAETKKISASIETTYQVGKRREHELQGALATQKSRVLILNKQRDELNVLRRDIESAQRAFEMVSLRASQTNIESRATQTNISVLNSAVAPNAPSKPRLLINTIVSIFLGILLGVAVALMLELANRRVRTTDDLLELLKMPLLGSVSAASGRLPYTPTGARA